MTAFSSAWSAGRTEGGVAAKARCTYARSASGQGSAEVDGAGAGADAGGRGWCVAAMEL
jgi:hypothetical protein